MNETQIIAFFDELEKEAGHPSDRKWKALIGGAAALSVGTGDVLGREMNHAGGYWSNVPGHIVEHIKGVPHDTRSPQARAIADFMAKQPKTQMADSPKFLAKKLKEGSVAEHLTEIAGLGVLAKPSIDRLRGKEVDERKAAKQEIAGLGILAAPSALKLGKSAYNKFKTFKG